MKYEMQIVSRLSDKEIPQYLRDNGVQLTNLSLVTVHLFPFPEFKKVLFESEQSYDNIFAAAQKWQQVVLTRLTSDVVKEMPTGADEGSVEKNERKAASKTLTIIELKRHFEEGKAAGKTTKALCDELGKTTAWYHSWFTKKLKTEGLV